MTELWDRVSGAVSDHFGANLGAQWVLVGVDTGEILGSGGDGEFLSQEVLAAQEAARGERLHIFDKPPMDIGLNGQEIPVYVGSAN